MRTSRVIVALLLGALVGLALGVIVKGQLETDTPPLPEREVAVHAPTNRTLDDPIAGAALEYARAMQEDDWDEVVRRTWWMRARLDRVQAEGQDPAEARRALIREVSDRDPLRNRLRSGDIADQYIFTAGAQFEVLLVDEGEEDLEPLAMGRAWMRVLYARKDRAPLNAMGLPIRSLVAGVNVDSQGFVLKAGISGNLNIDEGSISLNWE